MTQLVFPLIFVEPTSFLSGELQRVSNLRTSASLEGGSVPPSMSVTQWIQAMDPYIYEDHSSGTLSVQLRPEDELGVLAGTDYAALAEYACTAFNTLPPDIRSLSTPAEPIQYDIVADAACTPAGKFSSFWWGYKWYMNHCLVSEIAAIAAGGGGAAGIAAAITAIFPPAEVATLVVGIAAGYLAVYSAALSGCDAHCTQGGAYLNGTWASIATPWCSAVC